MLPTEQTEGIGLAGPPVTAADLDLYEGLGVKRDVALARAAMTAA